MIRLIILIVALLVGSVALQAHAIYVSVANVSFQPAEKELKIQVRMFSDDLEAALKQRFPEMVTQSDSLLGIYLAEQFRIKADGKSSSVAFLRKSIDADATVCELICPVSNPPSHLRITNKVLMNAIEAQTNIVRIRIGKQKKVLNLTSGLPYDEVEF